MKFLLFNPHNELSYKIIYWAIAVAVVKVGDKVRGENFIAYVVGNADKKIIRQALTPAESPKEIIFVDALPLNASGKVDKNSLKQLKQLLAD